MPFFCRPSSAALPLPQGNGSRLAPRVPEDGWRIVTFGRGAAHVDGATLRLNMSLEQPQLRVLRAAGLAVWALVGLPVAWQHGLSGRVVLAAWGAAYVSFGVALLMTLTLARSVRGLRLAALAVQGVAVIVMVRLLCKGWEGSLLVLIAAELGILVGRRAGLAWVVAQSALFAWGVASHWSPGQALLLTPPYLGLQLLALLGFQLLVSETRTRLALARANAELVAVHRVLGESSRLAERIRISRELHDALGHHLTALSLNLEVASHQTQQPALESVKTAQSLTKLLLGDVRDIVRAMQLPGAIAVRPVLEMLASAVPRPSIHLDVPASLTIADPTRAHVLIRCAQEIITNAIRHSGAANLWLEVALEGDQIQVRARDDGRGAEAISPGAGLSGLRERLRDIGGSLELTTSPGLGVRVTAFIPEGGQA